MPIEEGFHGQRLVVVPRPVVARALGSPITRRLVVTDAGYYPHAEGHLMRRPHGTSSTIVIFCVTGAGWVRVGGKLHHLSGHQAAVILPNTPHEYGARKEQPWSIWFAHLAGSDVSELVGNLDVTTRGPLTSIGTIEHVVALLDEIVTTLERDQSPARLLGTSGAAWKLMTELGVDQLLPELGGPLERAMAYLRDRLDGSITVSELAALVGVSPSHLGTLFRRATGGGVLAYHTALRMARARQLLDVTDASVQEVGRDVGFSDPFYFSRHFRRHHGMSPTQYRERDRVES